MIKVSVGTDEVIVRGESKQWSVGRMMTNKKTGEVSFNGESYYSSLEGLIRGLLEMKLRASDANTLTELQMNLKQYRDELRGLYDTGLSG